MQQGTEILLDNVKVGDTVTFLRTSYEPPVTDTVRAVFFQVTLGGKPRSWIEGPAVTLTDHSWAWVQDLLTVNGNHLPHLAEHLAVERVENWPLTNDCSRCDGTGEIVVASYNVGDDAYNDDFDSCPRCKGTGTEPR